MLPRSRSAPPSFARLGTVKKPTKPGVYVITLRLKVRAECYPYLRHAAREVNFVWNWGNETCFKAIKPYSGPGEWLSAFTLDKLSAGAGKECQYIGADTIQRINAELVRKRIQFKKQKLAWRKSGGSKRSLGWVPFKAATIKRAGKYVRYAGKTIRFFESDRFAEIAKWGDGCFAEDAVGDWWLCVPVERAVVESVAPLEAVGIDLGLKDVATTSDGDKLHATHYRNAEEKLGQLQRRGHRRQAKRLSRKIKRQRAHDLHVFSRRIVDRYQLIVIGDVSSLKLVKTRMAKSVLDAGWGMLKTQLQYKGEHAGRTVSIVNEANTTRACSLCRALTGPSGVNGLRVRTWTCGECGVTHDRDINAANNTLAVGRSPPSVRGNEPKRPSMPSSKAPRLRKTRTASKDVAA